MTSKGLQPYDCGVDKLLIARHAETDYNVDGLINGDPTQKVALTERGWQQAEQLGKSLKDISIDLCVTTEFHRTRETADIALGRRPIPRLILPELNDPRVGIFEGRTFNDYIAWRHAHGPLAIEPGGGESLSDVLRRYCSGFRFIAEQPGSTVVVIAHGLPVSVALLAHSAMDETIPVEFPQARAADMHTIDTLRLLSGLVRIERAVDAGNFAGPAPHAART